MLTKTQCHGVQKHVCMYIYIFFSSFEVDCLVKGKI